MRACNRVIGRQKIVSQACTCTCVTSTPNLQQCLQLTIKSLYKPVHKNEEQLRIAFKKIDNLSNDSISWVRFILTGIDKETCSFFVFCRMIFVPSYTWSSVRRTVQKLGLNR